MSSRYSVTRLLPWGLLAASLAVNVSLLDRAKWNTRGSLDPGAQAPGLERLSRAAEAREPSSCEERLGRLEASERVRIALALRSLVAGLAGAARSPGRPAPSEGWRDDEDQEDALARVAKRHLRAHWTGQKATLTASLRKSLANAEEQARNLAEETRSLAQDAGLGQAERDRFGERYAPVRQARLAAVLVAIGEDPPAYDAALEEVLGLFADEDRLISELGGVEALRRLREERCEGRTAVTAIAAALAGLPWDESIRW